MIAASSSEVVNNYNTNYLDGSLPNNIHIYTETSILYKYTCKK